MEPVFITFEQVIFAHEESLCRHGGSAGIRDEGLLRSAIHQPPNDYSYGGADLFGIAAAYAFHIAQAQAFLDGNKRTAATVALVFFELNGVPTTANTAVLYDAMIGIAGRRLDKPGLAAVFRGLFGEG
ncbi:MAG: type II toxin-antitoxin system death-on-curing family toxin [Chthoniobacterales bacterium]